MPTEEQARRGSLGQVRDPANLGDRNARDPARDLVSGTRGEKQLAVVAAVQRVFHVDFMAADGCARTRFFVQQRAPAAALLAHMGKVRGEPVAEVNHGGSNSLLAQHAPDLDARLGVEKARMIARAQLLSGVQSLEGSRGGAKF